MCKKRISDTDLSSPAIKILKIVEIEPQHFILDEKTGQFRESSDAEKNQLTDLTLLNQNGESDHLEYTTDHFNSSKLSIINK